jgi:hypothetical protein
MRKIILILLFLSLSGCTAAILTPLIGGTGALIEGASLAAKAYLTWKDQEATAYYKQDIDTVYRAVNHTAKALSLTVNSDDKNKDGKGYHLSLADKERIKVTIVPQNGLTAVKIRILFKEDQPYVEFFYQTVTNNLNNIVQFQNGKPVRNRFHLLRRGFQS